MKTDCIAAMCRLGRPFLISLAAASCLLVTGSELIGQQAQSPAKKPGASDEGAKTHDAEPGFLVIPLKYTLANELQGVLLQILRYSGAGEVVANSRTNSLIVHATSSDALEAIPALIKKLDVPAEEEHRVKARVFKPQRIVLDDRVAQQLRVAVSLQGRMAVDENGNLVVVQDTDESLAAFAALLSRLDEGAAENPPPAVLRLRVVWLVSGMERKETTALPSDLKGVVSDLAKIGVEGLQIAAQTMVNTAVIDCFQVQCSPDLDNPCDLTISGSFSVPKGKMPSLQIQIRGEERVAIVGRDGNRSQSSRTLCHLNTTIQAPRGHFVVLGAVPVGKMNSVFVVQVTGE